MSETREDILDLRLKNPFTMLVSGPTACGKTTFTRELLIRRNLLNTKPNCQLQSCKIKECQQIQA